MTAPHMISHAQNGEDVVLWRALHRIDKGRYVEVGANSATHDSISWAFYDAGWSGITVEPIPAFAAEHRAQRPRDTLVEAAVTAEPIAEMTIFDIPETGLSTASAEISDRHRTNGFTPREITVAAVRLDHILEQHLPAGSAIHFMTVDTEGSEKSVLESMDFRTWRPWVLVIEATAPLTNTLTHGEWEALVLEADYRFVLFDGLSRFYVANEHYDELAPDLSYPACVLDNFDRVPNKTQQAELDELVSLREEAATLRERLLRATHDVIRWRSVAIEGLARGTATVSSPEAQEELQALQRTISWRVTAPLRRVRPKLNREVEFALKLKNRLGR